MTLVFDGIAKAYDDWFESPEGKALYQAELSCLRSLIGECQGRWLEVGVGTGRFATQMDITEGVDPSPRMLEIAESRGIKTYQGQAEDLPFPDSSFNGILIALALCFIPEPEKALKECHRILRKNGSILIGDITADSPWGQLYEDEKAKGDPVWSRASFLPASELASIIENAGFNRTKAASTLFWGPAESPEVEPRMDSGIVPGAGFVGLLFTSTG